MHFFIKEELYWRRYTWYDTILNEELQKIFKSGKYYGSGKLSYINITLKCL